MLQRQVVCTNLVECPDIDLNEAVDKVLTTYATERLSEESRGTGAPREQSASRSCLDQSERVAADLTE